MNRLFILFFLALALVSCNNKESINKFSDPVLVKIADLKDRRLSDSLYQYFDNENAVYRKEAVLAFGSIQDTSFVEKAFKLLTDADADVRIATAFAIGQTGGAKAIEYLNNAPKDTAANGEISEAIGKAVKKFSDASRDINSWGLYRLGLRGLADSLAIIKATEFLRSKNENTRLGAAHFFARGSSKISMAESTLIDLVKNDPSAEVRMAAVIALRKIKTDSCLSTIQYALENDSDYRVRVNAIQGLRAFPFEKIKDLLFKATTDKNINVGIAASEAIKATADRKFWVEIANLADVTRHWRIQADIYQAALKSNDNKSITDEIIVRFKSSKNPYQKAALLTSLQESVRSVDFVIGELLKEDVPVIRTSAASALVSINKKENFPSLLKKRLAEVYKQVMASGDAAVIGTIAEPLGDSTLGYRDIIKDFNFLYEAKKKLSLPKDNEALQPLEAAIAYFEKKKNNPTVKNEFNHPIDWDLVRSIPKDQQAIIKTTKGKIIMRLLVEESPGSVANFVQLALNNYFDQKFFHRVVPNFVIQAGCNRGDGWGGEDYSIRSEFSPRKYKTGSVGMASAGKDTEGTQWFITHSPTPHLDGRYTIFAEVENGMEVVHQIEVGDQIINVELPNYAGIKKER